MAKKKVEDRRGSALSYLLKLETGAPGKNCVKRGNVKIL